MTDDPKTPPLASALRELRLHLARPVVAVTLAGVASVQAIVAPFDDAGALSFPARLLYWLAVVLATYSAGYLTSSLVHRLMRARLPRRLLPVLAVLATTLVVTLVLIALNAAIGIWPDSATDLARTALVVLAVTTAIEAASLAAEREAVSSAPRPSAPPSPPAILDRLPPGKRGPLVSLSVEDHYVRITTLQGQEMVLMRLSDAIRETQGTAGLQIHRSHWVALSRVARIERRGDGGILHLDTGASLPISRAGLKTARAAGLLPRSGPAGRHPTRPPTSSRTGLPT